jgi:hypothetical protein
MPKWLLDTKDGDKIALILLFTGVFMVIAGATVTFLAILYLREEARLDRAIIALAGVGSQGSGLVTAGMGVLRFQQKSPTNGSSTPTPPTGGSTP